MINENEKRILEKLNFFLDEKVVIHIHRNDRKFWNGVLLEKKNNNVFILKERVLGLVHLFVKDVYEVEEYMEARK